MNGYTQTFEYDGILCAVPSTGTCDGEASITGTTSGINFGYFYDEIATLVSLVDFQAYQAAEGVVVEWQTGSEQGTVGFWLERKDKDSGKFIRINTEIMPSLALQGQQQGGTYQMSIRM